LWRDALGLRRNCPLALSFPEGIALGVGLWGAALSTLLALRQISRERRRVIVKTTTLLTHETEDSGDYRFFEVLEIRAHNAGTRPVFVFQAGVVTERGYFHPQRFALNVFRQQLKPPCMLNDGDTVSFFFDLLSFEGEWLPKRVWVQDNMDRRYEKRLSRKRQRELGAMILKLRERVGPDVESQKDVPAKRAPHAPDNT
jgi:hypothetical protein